MSVAILGGGLQGCCAALALAMRGIRVTLYERNSTLLAGAATANEGKIHLGYTYASDRSLNTSRTLLRGALSFAPLIQRYLDVEVPLAASEPFVYAVHRDSQVNVDDIAAHLGATHTLVNAAATGRDCYFGIDLSVPPQRLPQAALERRFDPTYVTAAFDTGEIAIDAVAMAMSIRRRIAEDPELMCERAERSPRSMTTGPAYGYTARASTSVTPDRESFSSVVNALWDGRLAIDAMRGVHPGRKWIHRFKHGIRFRLAETATLPSVTIVLGPFGDLVAYGGGLYYVSWYPACMTAHSDALVPPPWRAQPDEPCLSKIVTESFAALGAIIPQLQSVRPQDIAVRGGVIVAWGSTDIDDRASELHRRHDIGVHSYGSYHSIDPGKLTMAPHFAAICADRILAKSAAMTAPLIGVGVPVWRGAVFVAETLELVLNQRGVQFKIFISIDGADADSERACLPFASDPRVQIVLQPRRLGWVKNTAAVLAGAGEQAEFVCVQPHDDWVERTTWQRFSMPRELTLTRLSSSATFLFLERIKELLSQESVTGTPIERQSVLLTRHFNAVAYRGLNRTSALKTVPPISGNNSVILRVTRSGWRASRVRDISSASPGNLSQAVPSKQRPCRVGELAQWQKGAAWIRHCLDMLAEALPVATDKEERQLLIDAARARLWLRRTLNLVPMPSKLRHYRGYAGGECRWPSRPEQRYGPTSVLWAVHRAARRPCDGSVN